MAAGERRLLILYGSQTGNAQDVAERVAREAALLLYRPAIMAMDSYPLQQLPEERFVVFVTSTTGQGDPPDNMRRFWKLLLRKSLPATILGGMRYAVFGLGDSGYVKFNVAAKKLDRRLAALGATPLLERGLGDDQHPSGYEATLDPWLQQLWASLRQQHDALPPGTTEPVLDAATLLQLGPAKYVVTPLDEASCTAAKQQQQQQQQGEQPTAAEREQQLIEQAVATAAAFRAVAAEAAGFAPAAAAAGPSPATAANNGSSHGPWRPFMAPLVANARVTAPGHFQETRHLEFDLAGSGLSYEPGDLLAIFPRTPAADVEAALERLGLDGDAWVRVQAAHPPAARQGAAAAVCDAPIRALLQGVLDLSGASPRRYLFQVLSHFTQQELHRERLEYFATAEGRDDQYRYNQRERRSLLEVLQDFGSAQPPLARLLEAAPLLQPRQFSLASAPAAHGSRAAILMAVVAWRTPSSRPRRGLLTSWLAGLRPDGAAAAAAADGSGGGNGASTAAAVQAAAHREGSSGGGSSAHAVRVPVWVDRGAFRLPPDPSTPLLLVGPGTGVAPFRSFCWHRAALRQQQQQQQQQQQAEGGGGSSAAASSCLFFGCRSPTADFYYEPEWWTLMQGGALHPAHGFVVAFSRHQLQPSQQELLHMLQAAAHSQQQQQQQQQQEQQHLPPQQQDQNGTAAPAARGRVYVTHKLRELGSVVWQLLAQQGAWVYVSGSAEKMPAGVCTALEEVAAQHGGLSREEAAKFVRQLELTGRYHVEAWS